MAEDRDELIQHYWQMRRTLLAAIDGFSDALLSELSLDGWSVKDHLAHLALWGEIRAAEVARISAGYKSAWRMSGEQDTTYSGLGHNLCLGLSVAQVRWELETTRQRLLDAIAAATPPDSTHRAMARLACRTHAAQHTGWIRSWRDEKGV